MVGSQEKDPKIDFLGVLQSVCAEGPPEVATRWQPCRRVHGAPSTAHADSRPDPFSQGRVGGPWVPLPELLALATRSVVPKVNRGNSPKPPNSPARRSALSVINGSPIRPNRSIDTNHACAHHSHQTDELTTTRIICHSRGRTAASEPPADYQVRICTHTEPTERFPIAHLLFGNGWRRGSPPTISDDDGWNPLPPVKPAPLHRTKSCATLEVVQPPE